MSPCPCSARRPGSDFYRTPALAGEVQILKLIFVFLGGFLQRREGCRGKHWAGQPNPSAFPGCLGYGSGYVGGT